MKRASLPFSSVHQRLFYPPLLFPQAIHERIALFCPSKSPPVSSNSSKSLSLICPNGTDMYSKTYLSSIILMSFFEGCSMRMTLLALDASSLSPYHEPPKLVIAVMIPEDSVSSFRCSTSGSNSLMPSEPEKREGR